MAVDESGDEHLTGGIDYLGLRPDGVASVRCDMGNPGTFYAHRNVIQQLAGVHVQQPGAGDHQIGLAVAEGHLHQLRCILVCHGVGHRRFHLRSSGVRCTAVMCDACQRLIFF